MQNTKSLVKLDDLIVPGPVERGFYIASGSRNLVPLVLDRLVELLGNEDQPEEEQHTGMELFSPAGHRTWRRHSQIGQLIWVDSGNVFDPYYLAARSRVRGLDPARVLRAVKVGRPFTAYQFQQMLERVPNPALWAPDSGDNAPLGLPQDKLMARGSLENSRAVWWTPLVIISDLMGLFYDEELPEEDRRRAFRELLTRLDHLRQRAIVLALLVDHVVPPARRTMLPEVFKLAKRVTVNEPLYMLPPYSSSPNVSIGDPGINLDSRQRHAGMTASHRPIAVGE